MVSESGSLEEFVDRVRGKHYEDLVFLVDQEATDAERRMYSHRRDNSGDPERFRRYADQIKDFLLYLRHGVKTAEIGNVDLQGFRNVDSRPS